MKLLRISKFAGAALLVTAGAGCETMAGDPYYADRYEPVPVYGGGYGSPYGGSAVYPAGAYPVYPAYPIVDRRDRWEDMRNERERRAWRERQAARERERERIEREARQRREVERNRDRDIAQHERRIREREIAERQRAQRERANRNDLNPDGSPRTDYDNYNPKTGSFLPRSDRLP